MMKWLVIKQVTAQSTFKILILILILFLIRRISEIVLYIGLCKSTKQYKGFFVFSLPLIKEIRPYIFTTLVTLRNSIYYNVAHQLPQTHIFHKRLLLLPEH